MDELIKTFELSTVTYGTTSAPFLATRTLKQLALDEAENFPLGSSVVMSDMYIDDVLTGAETLLEAKELKNQLISIFAKGGMVLHKWCGNNTELIEVSENYDFSDSSEIKVLGVYWNHKHDCFSFRVKIDLHELNTKRDVLSTIAMIYDPLGLLGPVVAKAKIFLQKLWMLKIDWTDLLPDTINGEWRQFVESLQVVNDININQCIVVEQPKVIELHEFSEASLSAYGAVVYCKSITSDRKMLVHLIASKSRVAPTKQTTIPRLELSAAVLLAKLVHRVKQALKLNVTNTFLWSDSMIVLSWIRKESYQLKTFVANRIATIQEMTSSEQWRYVATEDNPADFVSRGMDSLKLKTCELWWNGSKFLMSNQYPQQQIPVAVIKDLDNLVALHFQYDQARRRFVEWAQNEIAVVPDFHKQILLSDEAHFWLNGYVNKQNCRNRSEANSQVYVETPLHPEKLTVWCALWAGGIIGPYFFKNDEGHNVTVNGEPYRAMITNFFIPELNNHDVQELWFQQDGATCHTARATINLLKDTFGDRLIGRFGFVNWPPRSCDLTPLDYFLWSYVKSLVNAVKPRMLDHLEDNIRRVIADIRPQMLEKVIENWTSRLDYIRASRGSHMPEIIFKM
ncbi:uncharacterized protein TNCV_629571 [Trichonephila clavipes]|nr:uncharacterized protein TNCV_629571 [Trichonephila clavipes]